MLLLSFVFALLVTPVDIDEGDYMEFDWMEELLEQDLSHTLSRKSEAFFLVSNYMDQHFETVDLITASYNSDGDLYYYTAFGSNENGKSVQLLKVSKELFEKSSYYETSSSFTFGSCRSGFPWYEGPFNVCTSSGCATQTTNCLGVNCEPCECNPSIPCK